MIAQAPQATVDRSNETTAAGIPWVQFASARGTFRARWPSIWDLPVTTSIYSPYRALGITPQTVLDVGATDRRREPDIQSLWPSATYRSLDIDRTHRHDYHDFTDVCESFDLVLCLEVIEHVSPSLGLKLLRSCARVCRPSGYLLVSVPNVLTPGMQSEFTHQSAFSYLDLAGCLSWCGLELVDGARFCTGGPRFRLLHNYIFYALHRFLRIDDCQSVVMLGRRRATEQPQRQTES